VEEEHGDAITVSDLYAMRFNPILSAADFKLALQLRIPFHM